MFGVSKKASTSVAIQKFWSTRNAAWIGLVGTASVAIQKFWSTRNAVAVVVVKD